MLFIINIRLAVRNTVHQIVIISSHYSRQRRSDNGRLALGSTTFSNEKNQISYSRHAGLLSPCNNTDNTCNTPLLLQAFAYTTRGEMYFLLVFTILHTSSALRFNYCKYKSTVVKLIILQRSHCIQIQTHSVGYTGQILTKIKFA